ncbi:acyltransferase [Pseudocnuella soli]|uniref:acyltransferase n=1 Tax=Pseudocnuella soli TaxID=2502779 RepID=UPI0010535C3C|nr:acyltransferase [Pseudocnuella soli]
MSYSEVFIHPTAVVDEGAVIGAGTRIWHFCHLMPRSRVGQGCNIGQNVFIDNEVVVGNGVKVQNNVSLYNGVIVEDDTFIGPSAVFTNVINPRSFIERKSEFRTTLVRRGASIGANATIVCGVTIGEYALVGAGAVVTKDVPAYALVVGNPAQQQGWVSRAGYRLAFNSLGMATCTSTGEIYGLQNGRINMLSSFDQ